MRAKRSVFVFIFLTVIGVAFQYALELKDGRIKIILHEDTGRFSVNYLSDVEKGTYLPLLVNQDPRTTSLSVLFGTKVFRMGDTSQFTQSVFETSKSIGFEWKSNQFNLREEFSCISSGTSVLSDGISIRITITNVSETGKPVAIRYLLDTWLGEAKKTHFKTDVQPKITSETALPGNGISYIISQDLTTQDSHGFQLMTKAPGASLPEKIVMANWKRLNESSWIFDTVNGREFSLLPYSVNDSAVLAYYPEEVLAKDASREITLFMGHATPLGFGDMKKVDSSISTLYESSIAANADKNVGRDEQVKTEMMNIDNFILQIDRKIKSGEIITDEEISVFRKVLEEMRKRKEQLEE